MTEAPVRQPERRSPGLLLIPLLAIVFGAAAVLLNGGVGLGPAGSQVGGSGGGPLSGVTYQEAGFLAAILVGSWVLWSVYKRIRGQTASLPVQFLLSALVVFALVIAFIGIVHLFVHGAPGPPEGGLARPGGTNSTSGTAPVGLNNSTGPAPPPGFPYPPGWPWWAPYVALGAVGLLVGGIAVPLALARSHLARPTTASVPASTAVSAIGSALSTLDGYHGDDPRATIISLYAQLLQAVGPRAGPLEPKTARELSEELVLGLGVSRSVSNELTDRFEEARYSHRPLGPEAVARTRAALSRALDELASSRPTP